jgi:Ca-activated chloride channel family protein
MNSNETNPVELDAHAMLTALVLDELEPELAEQWNARCAAEPELAALRDSIRATIGAVHAALPSAPTLSAQTLAALKSAALAGPKRPAFGRLWSLAIAAGAVLGVGFALTRLADDVASLARVERRPRNRRTLGTHVESAASDPKPGRYRVRRRASIVPWATAGGRPRTKPSTHRESAFFTMSEGDRHRPPIPSSSLNASKLGVPRSRIRGHACRDALSLGTCSTRKLKHRARRPRPEARVDDHHEAPVPHAVPSAIASHFPVATAAGPTSGGGPSSGPVSPGESGAAPGGGRLGKAPGGRPATVGGPGGTGGRVRIDEATKTPASPAPAQEKAAEAKKAPVGGATASTRGADPYRGPGDSVSVAERPGAVAAGSSEREAIDLLEEVVTLKDFDVETAQGAAVADRLVVDVPAEQAKRIIESCRPRPNELPRDMFFRWYGDHAFQRAALDRLSTFAIDVDTASYTLARKYLAAGQIPPKEAVRTEEFVNYFKPDLGAPTDGSPFAIWLEAAPSPFGNADGKSRWLLRVGVRAKDVAKEARPPLRLAFVVDTSGSMAQENRLELVKHGLRLLASQLDARDKIAIVRFASDASVVLQWTSAADRASIEAAIHGLSPNGSTNAEAGLKLGYDLAVAGLDAESTNRVVILSDGVANTGQTDQDRISADVKDKRQRGIYLNAIGVGMGNHNDVFLERLADQGDGQCSYIDDELEAKRALVDQFVAQTTPVARDVKIQVEFDPAQIESWRQLGYENRAIADVDFRNDAIDAGEIGAGHQIVALYELEPIADPTRGDGPFTTIRLRYKQPYVAGAASQNETAQEITATIPAAAIRTTIDEASVGFQQSALVAQFAEFLRRSVHARGDSIDDLLARVVALAPRIASTEFTEFTQLVDRSRTLIAQSLPRTDELTQAVDALRRNQLLTAELRQLAQAHTNDVLRQLEEQNRRLEEEVRRLIEQRLK